MTLNDALRTLIAWPIIVYRRVLSPFLPKTCRFEPTCSAYALEAIKKHGTIKGLMLSIWRILRCNPWHMCAFHDPVPEAIAWRDMIRYKRGGHDKNIKLKGKKVHERTK